MYTIRAVIRRLIMKTVALTQRFMQGRYGTDKLNTAILVSGLVACVLSMFIRLPLINWLLTVGSYVLMGWAIFRSLSRNTYKRYQENRKYLRFLDRIKDREHKYFDCPRCQGKISITCPKCGEKFVKKT